MLDTSKLLDTITLRLQSNQDPDLKAISEEILEESFEQVYAEGDRIMKGFMLLHFGLALLFAFFHQTWVISLAVSLAIVGFFWLSAYLAPRTFLTRVVAGVVLQCFVTLHIYQLHGINEVRFFFFTAFTMMIVYQDWKALSISSLLLVSQYFIFTYLNYKHILDDQSYADVSFGLNQSNVDVIKIISYLGISLMQVALCSFWAYILSLHTIKEVEAKMKLVEKQSLIEQNNQNLETLVKEKTKDLQMLLETTQASEEELRQNMEELQATQEELEKQSNQILEKNVQLQIAEQELIARQTEMEKTQWLESNIAHFDNLLRLNYDKSIEEFSDITLTHLAELLEAMQGAMYVYNPENQLLEITGGYACTITSVSRPTFMLGDGLLGQVAKNKQMLYMEDIKEGAAEIASALTKIKSRSLLIVPMIYNEHIQGLLEFATTENISTLHLEFIQRATKNIAAVLLNIRSILHTKKLLEQYQNMTTELQKNAQELSHTKSEMDSQMLEFQNQYDAIDRVMLVIEYATNGMILNVNQNFLQLAEYTPEELIGKHQSVFIAPDFLTTDEYKQIWERAKHKDFLDAVYKCQSKEGNIFWIKSNYYISDKNGIQKLVAFATDITAQKLNEEKLLHIQEQLLKREPN